MSAGGRSGARVLSGTALASLILGAAALTGRPQGNVGRAVPHLVAEAAVLGTAAWLRWGRRALVMAVTCYAAVACAGVVAYLLFFEPIGHAECGTLVEELGNAACRRHARGRWLLGGAAAGVAVVATAAAVTMRPGRGRPRCVLRR